MQHISFSSKPKALIRNKTDSRGVTQASQRRVAKAPCELTGKLHSNKSPSVFPLIKQQHFDCLILNLNFLNKLQQSLCEVNHSVFPLAFILIVLIAINTFKINMHVICICQLHSNLPLTNIHRLNVLSIIRSSDIAQPTSACQTAPTALGIHDRGD